MPTAKVRLTHPKAGGPIEVDPEAVPGWEALGWKPDTGTTRKTTTAKEA